MFKKRPEKMLVAVAVNKSAIISRRYTIGCIFLMLISLILFTGCRGSKELVIKPSKQDTELIKQLVLEDPSFESLDSKMEFRFFPKEGVNVGMKGSMKIRRDSCLIISLQPFAGVEMVKCLITPEKMILISRIHSAYSVVNIEDTPFANLKPYELLEPILINRIFFPGNSIPGSKDIDLLKWNKDKEGKYLSLAQDGYELSFRLDDNQHYNQLIMNTDKDSTRLKVLYSLFKETSTGDFPHQIEMQTFGMKQNYKLELTFLKPSFDTPTDFKFNINSKYKQVPLEDLIKRFQNML
jgi:hypothetical protein